MRQLHFIPNVEYNPLRAVVTCAESGASCDFEVVPASGFQTNAAMWELSEGYAWELAEGICEFLELNPGVDLAWDSKEVWERARCQWYDKDHEVDLEEAKREMEGI